MRVCYLRPAPLGPSPIGADWARALGAETLDLEELARRMALASSRRRPLPYDVLLVDLVQESVSTVAAAARLLLCWSSCKLVVHAAAPLPSDARDLGCWLEALELSDLVISPSRALCAEMRRRCSAPAYELAPPCRPDAASWCPAPGADGASAPRAAEERGRSLAVISAARPSHWRLLLELGPVAHASTLLAGRVRWLDASATAAEREQVLAQSAFAYLPEPIEDGGVLAADCARLGTLLIAHLGYTPARVTFPYTTFDDSRGRRRLLLLWLHTSREFREFFRESALHGAVWLRDDSRRVQLARRLQYQFPEHRHELPEAGGSALLDQIKHRRGPLDVRCEARECLLVCLVRNGQEHVHAFLSHYRSLGVRHFFFIDNGSDDRTLELLEAQPDVTTYATALPHKHYEREIRRLIIERHCRGSWCLNVDIDELFDYPRSGELGLVGLLAYLSERRYTAMAGYMLDMYARENTFGPAREPALDLRSAYPCYDIENITRTDYFTHQVKAFCAENILPPGGVPCYFGGIRQTLFGSKVGEDYLLTKHPLIFLDGMLEPVTHPHYSNAARVADITSVLYHYKFTPSFKAKVEESRASGRYVKFAQGQYDQYQRQLALSASLIIDTPGTQRLSGVDELVERGFLRVSSEFEAHVRSATRGRSERPPTAGASATAPSLAQGPAGGVSAVTVGAILAVVTMLILSAHTLLQGPAGADATRPLIELPTSVPGALAQLVELSVSTFGLLALLVVSAAALYLLVGSWKRRRPLAFVSSSLLLGAAFTPIGAACVWFACGVVVVSNALAYLYLASRTALRALRQGSAVDQVPRPSGTPPSVCIVVPARDEEAVIEETLRALDTIDYPPARLQIVVIDDGSTDRTRARGEALAAEMGHRVEVRSFDHSRGKALRLNELLSTLHAEFVLLLDADHRVAPDIVWRMLRHFRDDPDVAGVQAASAVRNGHVNCLTRALEMEYLFRCQGIYPGKPMGIFVGSGGLFRRAALLDVGGFDSSMLTEDVEMSYRLYASGKRIVYDPTACTYELATQDFQNFFNQRHRWMQGLWQAMLKHAPRSRSRRGLRRVLPYFVQFTSDGFMALCLTVLCMYAFLENVGVLPALPRLPLYLVMLGCSLSFSVGFVRGRRTGLIMRLPVVFVYSVLHAVPMAWALIDAYVLGKPRVWVKTERRAEPVAPIRWSRGRA